VASLVRKLSIAAVIALAAGRAASAEPDPPDRASAEMLAAHALARVALMDLRFSGSPGPRDYQVAEDMLGIASTLWPSDQELLRLYLESANGAGDNAAVRDITRRLVALDRQDTVAQLRAITTSIADLQTADDRLAAYDRFIGESGAAFDDSIRSRLALDAALLLRERGDMDGFRDRLAKACAFDPTNKDAATLALTYYAQGAPDPVGRFELMLNALEADPFDPSVYSAIVGELLSGGAYHGAARFAGLHLRLCHVLGRSPSADEDLAYELSEWHTVGAEAVIARLTDSLQKARDRIVEQRKAAQEHGQSLDAMPRPEELRLAIPRDRSRLIAAAALGDAQRTATFLTEIGDSINRASAEMLNPTTRPAGMSSDEATANALRSKVEHIWLRLWCGLELDEAARALRQLTDAGGLNTDTQARLEAWLALRTQSPDQAEGLLNALAERDVFGTLGLAVLAEKKGAQALAMQRYTEVMQRAPGELAGTYAHTRLLALTHDEPIPARDAALLEQKAGLVPSWVDDMVDRPRRVMALEVKPLRQDITAIERTPVRVTIRNVSPIPLALGPDKPINSRLMFIPTVDSGTGRIPLERLVDVTSLERRLRLMPGETLDIVAWPDIGPLSFAMEALMPKQGRVQWRVLQGFELSGGGERRPYEAGPLCLSAEVSQLVRRTPARVDAVTASLRSAFEVGGPREIADALLSLKLQIFHQRQGGLTAEDADRLMEVLARRFASLNKPTRILTLCLTPPSWFLLSAARIDQLAAQDPDEDVLATALVTRPPRAEEAMLTSPAVAKSERLSAIAQTMKARLTAKTATFSVGIMPEMTDLFKVPPETPPAQGKDPAAPAGSSPSATQTPKPSRVTQPSVPPDPSPIPSVP